MNFRINYFEIDNKDFLELIENARNNPMLNNYQSFFMIILSHGFEGGRRGKIGFVDEKNGIDLEEVLINFDERNCVPLAGKPKIFIVPCCRGTNEFPVQAVPTKRAPKNERVVPTELLGDVWNSKVCYANLNGFQTHTSEMGSYYVNALCATLADNAKDTDFSSIMTWVTDKVIEKRKEMRLPIQIPCVDDIGFRRLLFLSPGYPPKNNA